jgi:hypothetical protein
MGINWSNEEDEKDREDKATEALHELVWDRSRAIGKARVDEILTGNSVTSLPSVKAVMNAMKNSEADQVRKSKAYLKNNAFDWYEFHNSIANRYHCVSQVLFKNIYPQAPEWMIQGLDEDQH